MRRILAAVIIYLVAVTGVFAADGRMGWNGPVTGTLAASGTAKVAVFRLDSFRPAGFFSLQSTVAGSGTMTIVVQVTNAINPVETDWITPAGLTAIVTSQSVGTEFFQFPAAGEPMFAKWIRLSLTETTTTDGVTYTLYPNVQ